MQMILAGVAISSFYRNQPEALTQLFNPQQDLTFWFVGGAANITWQQLLVLSPILSSGGYWLFSLREVDLLIHLSESHAIALGGHPQMHTGIGFHLCFDLSGVSCFFELVPSLLLV